MHPTLVSDGKYRANRRQVKHASPPRFRAAAAFLEIRSPGSPDQRIEMVWIHSEMRLKDDQFGAPWLRNLIPTAVSGSYLGQEVVTGDPRSRAKGGPSFPDHGSRTPSVWPTFVAMLISLPPSEAASAVNPFS